MLIANSPSPEMLTLIRPVVERNGVLWDEQQPGLHGSAGEQNHG